MYYFKLGLIVFERCELKVLMNVGHLYAVIIFRCRFTLMYSCAGIVNMLVIVVGYGF